MSVRAAWIGPLLLVVAVGSAQARPIHIVAYGDSATAGYLVRHRDAYPAQLQAALRKDGYDVVVRNAGLNGDTSFGALIRLDQAMPPGTDIAIVEFGTNDRYRRTPLWMVRGNIDQLLHRLAERRIRAMVIGLGRLDLSAVARKNRVPYAQWHLSRGRYRARDGHHFNRAGYAILVKRILPKVERLIAQVRNR